jgi:peptidoglycan/LPS O-acetylase OafA/YrhL
LRGTAILLVFAYHLFLLHRDSLATDTTWLVVPAQMGWMGVDLFFVLSGFLISGILLNTKGKPRYLLNFFARRALRIWPLYVLCLGSLVFVAPKLLDSLPDGMQSMVDHQLWFWAFAANWLFALQGGFEQTSGGFFWSLAVEEQFYLIWPFVVLFASERMLRNICLVLLAISPLVRLVLAFQGVTPSALYTMTITHMDGLATGSFLALVIRSEALTQSIGKLLLPMSILATIGLVAAIAIDGSAFFWGEQMSIYGLSSVCLLSGCALIYARRADGASLYVRLLSIRFLSKCGTYSYSMYLIHVPVITALFPLYTGFMQRIFPTYNYNVAYIGFCFLALGICWMISTLSWVLLERPLLSLKRYF